MPKDLDCVTESVCVRGVKVSVPEFHLAIKCVLLMAAHYVFSIFLGKSLQQHKRINASAIKSHDVTVIFG